jgi:hypothetical protein
VANVIARAEAKGWVTEARSGEFLEMLEGGVKKFAWTPVRAFSLLAFNMLSARPFERLRGLQTSIGRINNAPS